ncbi:MAG: ABC transporter substrate-binding protein [Chloroflexota bacterium]
MIQYGSQHGAAGRRRRGTAGPAGALSRRALFGVAAGGGSAILAAACGPASGGATDATTASAGKPALRSGTKLVWAVGGSAGSQRETMRRQMVDLFHERHRGIEVELLFGHTGPTKLFTLFAGGNPPDLFRVSTQPYPAFVAQGLVEPYDALMKRDHFDTADFFPASLEQWRFQGKQWALPFLGIRVGYVDVGAYDEAGTERPPTSWKDPKYTWDLFLDRARRVTRPAGGGQLSRFGFRASSSQRDWQPWVWGNGGDLFSPDGKRFTLDEPPAVEALQFLADLIHKHHVAPTAAEYKEIGGQLKAFHGGRLTMYHAPINNVARNRDGATGMRWSLAALPHGPAKGAKAHSSGGGVGWFIPKDSPTLEEAWALLMTVVGKEGVRLEAMTGEAPPSRKSVAYSKEYLQPDAPPGTDMKVVVEALEVIKPDLPLVKGPEFADVIEEGLKPMWEGTQTARQAVEAIKPQVEAVLAGP